LGASRGLSLLPIDLEVLRAAARIRAATAARTPDAIQLATALAAGCTAFVTGDRRVPSLPRLPVVSLSGP
ncbi:MAG: PIN domain-containing protein, partial [Acidobacteriota bacterium]|nr:PIN domain-containing protein [Acidobacteriota bacterium]